MLGGAPKAHEVLSESCPSNMMSGYSTRQKYRNSASQARLAIGVRIVQPGQSSICGLREAARVDHSSSSASSSLVVALIFVVVVGVGVDRAQEVREDPLGYVASLLARLHVREAEVDAFPDARIDHIMGRIRETVVRACSLDGEWVRCRHREGHFVGPEEEGQGTGYGAGDVVGSGSVVGIVRIVGQGCQFASLIVSGLPSLSAS
jgi:hypothetical protein